MQSIWTNPSLQRSFIRARRIESDLFSCLKINLSDPNSTIMIIPNFEYDITFYEESLGNMYSIRALVEGIYEDQIKIKYLKNFVPKNIKNKNNTAPMPVCNCILNPTDVSKYDGPSTLFVPIHNIMDISYVKNGKPKPENGGIHVMLLGISATMVKAIIIKLSIFDDSIDDAVKYVDLKVNNIYNIAYEDNDGTIYESVAKVVSIEEVSDLCNCKPGKGYVREHIGFDNSVYSTNICSKKEFMSSPPVKKVKIVIDTSEDFSGRYESIMLDSIRDCTLISEVEDNITDTNINFCECCNHKTPNCNPNHCGHYIHDNCTPLQPTYVYNYSNYGSCISGEVTGEDVVLNIDGKKSEITLDDLLKYYLGLS